MRAVVHQTKGKLDLRSITVFGMNSKPETTTPIGYFGTGLKYAIAVLARNNLDVQIHIDRKTWGIEKRQTSFRDKAFHELFLVHNGLIVNREIKLPFTTELGKNWEVWQAFRELHSNTIDENGETFVAGGDDSLDIDDLNWILDKKDQTLIIVRGEEYVEAYHTKDNIFLPDGLTKIEGTDTIQIFKQPSRHVYYRGIRIFDLPENQLAKYTYNILAKLKLTEDRTAAEPFFLKMMIENYIITHKDPEIIKEVVTAHHHSYERSLNFRYCSEPSKEFVDVLESIDDKQESVNLSALEIRNERRSKAVEEFHDDWKIAFIQACERGNWAKLQEIYDANKEDIKSMLDVEESDLVTKTTQIQPEVQIDDREHNPPVRAEDNIPF